MTNYVPNYEELHYQVHPSQLGWAMHQLSAVPNYNVMGYAPVAGGMCIIVVQVPVGTPQVDWRAPQSQPRRRWPRLDWFRIGRGLALAVVAVALAYIAYGLFVDAGATSTQDPAAAMPWDAAGRAVGDTVDAIGRMIATLVVLVALAIAAFVAVKVWGRFRK